MAGVVASRNDQTKSRCIDDWYFGEGADRTANNESIRDAMRRFPDYHPTTVVLAVIEKRCGKLIFTD